MNYPYIQSDSVEIYSSSSNSSSESDEDMGEYGRDKISGYEAAALKRKEENRMLLKRLLKVQYVCKHALSILLCELVQSTCYVCTLI